MFTRAPGPVWHKRMQSLARQAGPAEPPLFAPLLFSIAASIEAIDPSTMAMDGTRIRRNVTELQQILGTAAVCSTVPSGVEAEAIGVPYEIGVWPPRAAGPLAATLPAEPNAARLARGSRLAAALDATRQWQTDALQPVVVAALTGPQTLCTELRTAGAEFDDDTAYTRVGDTLATIVRLYAEAGAHVIQLCERKLPPQAALAAWKGALGTIGNVARFHRVPPLLTVAATTPDPWPTQVLACPPPGGAAPPLQKAHGRTWPSDVTAWARQSVPAAGDRIVVTATEMHGVPNVAALRALVAPLLSSPG